MPVLGTLSIVSSMGAAGRIPGGIAMAGQLDGVILPSGLTCLGRYILRARCDRATLS